MLFDNSPAYRLSAKGLREALARHQRANPPSVRQLMGDCRWYDRLTDALRRAGLPTLPSDTNDAYTDEG